MKLFRTKTSRIITTLGINSVVLSVGVVIATISWYNAKQEIIPNDNVPSSILTSYFDPDSGDGSQAYPYVITKPVHFYNLSRLCAAGYDFDSSTCFRVGKKNIEGTGNTDYQVYAVDEDGSIKSGVYSKTLDMSFYNGSNIEHPSLVPIGTSRHPFVSKINGSNITIDGININGAGCSDIGVFGYVGSSASIRNLYFDNVSIDIGVPTGTDAYHTHADGKYNIGYIAGHVVEEDSFSYVYVNRAEVTNSVAPSVIGKTHYGIFGLCDSASTPITNSSVSEYRVDPNTVYSYMNTNYSSFSSKAVTTRNTEYTVSSTAFSTAFASGNSSYDLKGKSSGTSYNYSLSTIGHQGMDTTYNISYGNSHSNMLATTQVVPAGVSIDTINTPGTYMYYDTSAAKWKYYVITAGGSTSSVTFNVFTISYIYNSTTYYLYFDDSTTSLKATAYNNGTSPSTSSTNYWFCFKESLSSSDVGVESLASVGSSGRYYVYVPAYDKYLYITNSTTLNAGSSTAVLGLSGSGNTGSFAIDSIDSTISWIGTYQSNHSTVFAFQGSGTTINIVRPVAGNEASTFAINGSGNRVSSSTTASEEFQLITDISQITNGMKVGIGYPNIDETSGYYLMSTTQQTNNRGTVTTTVKSGTTLNCVSGAVKLTVSVNEQADHSLQYSLFDSEWDGGNGGYLYAASSSKNYLRTKAAETNWTIEINDASPYNAVITCQNDYTNNLMRFNYNNGSPLFACYSSGQKAICLYKYYQTSGTMYTANAANITVTISSGSDVTRVQYSAYYDSDPGGLHSYHDIDFSRERITWDFPNHQIIVAPLDDTHWEKVTSTAGVTNGDYLIVYEGDGVAFNGGIDSESYDVTGNNISVSISNNRIPYDAATEAAKFTYDSTTNSLKSATGYYIGRNTSSTGINASKTIVYTNTISFSGSDVVIQAQNNYVLRYNDTSGQDRFRYYSSNSVKAIQLYKLISESNDPEYIADGIEDIDANYDHNKIDVVGDASFTSSSVVLTSNLSNTKAISKWHADNAAEDGIGTKFYQTKYVGNSIVFFIPNQGTFDFGTIHFVCTSTNAPVFVKGTHQGKTGWESSIGFSDNRIKCENDSQASNTYDYTLSLNKYNIFNLSYAALNSSGNIISCYDTDGEKVLPTSTNVSLNSISTFVLAITTPSASMSISTINLKINNIEGNIANFSNVGYRTASYSSGVSTIDEEEVNNVTTASTTDFPAIIYRFDSSNANNRIYEKMVYDGTNHTYNLTFKCSVTTTIVIFNFDAEREKLYVNNVRYKESYHSITITGTTWYT